MALPRRSADSGTGFLVFTGVFQNRGKKNICSLATKLPFVAYICPFLDRLDAFSIARLLKITLVLLFFGETHYLPSLRASLGRELTQRRFSSAQIGPFLMQKSDPQASGGKNLT